MSLCRVGLYLWSRGLSGRFPPGLKFVPDLEYRDDGQVYKLPAMVAEVVNLAGEVMALHRTYLDPATPGKARVPSPKKLTPAVHEGATRGAAVQLHPVGATLGLAEGIETALAVHEATGGPCWATINAGGLEVVELPPEVEKVLIWADNDHSGTGRKSAEQASKRFRELGKTVWILEPDRVGHDWLDVFNDQHRPAFDRALSAAAAGKPWQADRTDWGAARKLTSLYGPDLRHDCQSRIWYVFDRGHWRLDTLGKAPRRAKAAVREMYREAAKIKDDEARKEALSWARKCESAKNLRAMLDLAGTEPGVPTDPEWFDLNPWLLNVRNGTLDLRTGYLRPHRRADLLSKLCPVAFDPSATAEPWEEFLDQVTGGDKALARYHRAVAGYTLTGDVREDCFFLHYGPKGRNGKGVYLNVLRRLMGGYALETNPETFMFRDKAPANQISPELAELQGARLVSASESDRGQRLSESLIKRVTGRDPIKARYPYQKQLMQFLPQFKLHLRTNYRPRIVGTDEAIWARVRVVPWPVSFKDREDKDLEKRLWKHAPGILNWCMAGVFDWQQNGLGNPPAVEAETSDYRAKSDRLGLWLEDCCEVGEGLRAELTPTFKAYKSWCEDNGLRALSKPEFTQSLEDRGFTRKRDSIGRFWDGFGPRLGFFSDRHP